jgi:hypothetical protein
MMTTHWLVYSSVKRLQDMCSVWWQANHSRVKPSTVIQSLKREMRRLSISYEQALARSVMIKMLQPLQKCSLNNVTGFHHLHI